MPDIIEVRLPEPIIVHEDQLLRMTMVRQLTGLSDTAIYDLIAEGRFPGAVELTGRAVAWRAREVLDWIRSRPEVKVRGRK